MALNNRIQFADSSDGQTNYYELTLNPVQVDIPLTNKSLFKKSVETIDGESIVFEPAFDSRRCKLIWKNIPYNYTIGGNNIQDQIDTLESYVDKYKYINFGDIAPALGVFVNWTKVKILSLDKSLRDDGGLWYETIVLVFELAE